MLRSDLDTQTSCIRERGEREEGKRREEGKEGKGRKGKERTERISITLA